MSDAAKLFDEVLSLASDIHEQPNLEDCIGKWSLASFENSFWKKVDKSGECWNWIGAKNNKGYGVFRRTLAHRVSYTLSYGDIPYDKPCICHKCDNTICVNPDHLFPGTDEDNKRDMLNKRKRMIQISRLFDSGQLVFKDKRRKILK
jgi:hypothetical protein